MKRAPEEGDEIVTAFRDGQVTLRSNRRVDGFTNAEQEHGYQRILPKDLVIHAMDAFAGAIGVSDSTGKSTPVYSVCRQKDPRTNVFYYGYLLRHMALSGFVNSLAKGIRERSTEFRWKDASNVLLPIPPFDEQRAIAAFLDAETSKIDALVAEQRRLIELLKEKRQAVISHAVTKGLNPHVKMKPSGIDWLGDVPEHWEVKALKHIGTICYGIGEPPTYYDDGVPLIRATNVRSGSLSPIGLVFVKPEQIPSQRIVWLQSGNIIVVRSGAGTGDSAIVPEDYGPAIAGFDMVLQVRFASPWYVQYSLLSDFVTKAQLDIVKTRAAQPHLNAQELGSCLIPLPPTKEQQEIVGFLSEQIHGFNELEKSAENAIALLQERRTALISAAVTGKIDVRGFVAKDASA
jgi:type I restriction enzyme S subunit